MLRPPAESFPRTFESALNLLLQPWCLLLAVLSESVRQEREKVIEYLHTENQVLREKHGMQRILLNDDQRRRLVVKGKVLSRTAWQEFATVAQADTILRRIAKFQLPGPRGSPV